MLSVPNKRIAASVIPFFPFSSVNIRLLVRSSSSSSISAHSCVAPSSKRFLLTAIFLALSFASHFARSWPCIRTEPASSGSCPLMLFRSVDLPAPLGPIRVRISPFSGPIRVRISPFSISSSIFSRTFRVGYPTERPCRCRNLSIWDHLFLTASIYMTTGAPIKDVTVLILSSVGANTIRAIRSE